ncbi:hypothetical protein GCM10009799_46920 [Nocardiopsis rhodophaea]|uniref:Uncharacterized protein n=1 Tax=Nocardiopsis rhodophaea TaxID=280238 RepID=A0ABP5F553_9ACTN
MAAWIPSIHVPARARARKKRRAREEVGEEIEKGAERPTGMAAEVATAPAGGMAGAVVRSGSGGVEPAPYSREAYRASAGNSLGPRAGDHIVTRVGEMR